MEVLWFEDIDPIKQPVFDLPLIGRVNMKQMAIICIALLIALASKDVFIAIVSLTLAILISMSRYKALNMDELIYTLLLYIVKHKVKPRLEPLVNKLIVLLEGKLIYKVKVSILEILEVTNLLDNKLNAKNNSNRYKSESEGNGNSSNDNTLDIVTIEAKPVRLRLRLLTRDKRPLVNKLARIYLDDELITSIVSDTNGELEVKLTFDDNRKEHRMLRVYVDGYSKPLFEETIMVKVL